VILRSRIYPRRLDRSSVFSRHLPESREKIVQAPEVDGLIIENAISIKYLVTRREPAQGMF
jgi:hypothetical protein